MLTTSEPSDLAVGLSVRQSVHGRDTRNCDMLVTPAIRSDAGRRRFLYSAVSCFNELPRELREMNRAGFKSALKDT